MSTKTDYAKVLGAEESVGSILFVVFVPSKTRNGDDLPAGQSQEMWAATGGDVLTEQFGGATQMPVAQGKWWNDKKKKAITEPIVLVHSYASPDDSQDETKLKELAKFLHRMGKLNDQGEIGIVIDNIFHKIRKFPLANEEAAK